MINMKVLDYRITSDSKQVIVKKVRRNERGEISMTTDKDGNSSETVSLVGCFGNLSRALVGIQRDYVLSSDTQIETIKDYRKSLETITTAVENEMNLGEEF